MNFDNINNCAVGQKSWTEKDGVIYFTVVSNGRTGEQWINHFTDKKIKIDEYAKSVLLSDEFNKNVTNNVTTEIAVLKALLWNDYNNRTVKNIRAKADEMKLSNPQAEVACLIRDAYLDEELKAIKPWWIVIMHEPIKDSDGCPYLFFVNLNDSDPCLEAYYVMLHNRFHGDHGFAFVVSSTSV